MSKLGRWEVGGREALNSNNQFAHKILMDKQPLILEVNTVQDDLFKIINILTLRIAIHRHEKHWILSPKEEFYLKKKTNKIETFAFIIFFVIKCTISFIKKYTWCFESYDIHNTCFLWVFQPIFLAFNTKNTMSIWQ